MNKKAAAIIKKLDQDEAQLQLLLEFAQTEQQKIELHGALLKIEEARNIVYQELVER